MKTLDRIFAIVFAISMITIPAGIFEIINIAVFSELVTGIVIAIISDSILLFALYSCVPGLFNKLYKGLNK